MRQQRVDGPPSVETPPTVLAPHVPMQQSAVLAHAHSPWLQRLPSASLQLELNAFCTHMPLLHEPLQHSKSPSGHAPPSSEQQVARLWQLPPRPPQQNDVSAPGGPASSSSDASPRSQPVVGSTDAATVTAGMPIPHSRRTPPTNPSGKSHAPRFMGAHANRAACRAATDKTTIAVTPKRSTATLRRSNGPNPGRVERTSVRV